MFYSIRDLLEMVELWSPTHPSQSSFVEADQAEFKALNESLHYTHKEKNTRLTWAADV